MAKYNFNFKMKVIKSYLDGEGGLRSIANQYGIGSETQVRRWINAYKTLGEDGLKRKKQKTCYTVQFKLDVINYMLITKSSVQEVANYFGMNNISLISAWKQKFLNGGVDALVLHLTNICNLILQTLYNEKNNLLWFNGSIVK